jgi:uncharacterized repeat protein (TIGR03806 family)
MRSVSKLVWPWRQPHWLQWRSIWKGLILWSGISLTFYAPLVSGQRTINSTLTLPTTIPAGDYELEIAWSQFNGPIALANPRGETNKLFVAERGGRIRVITDLAQDIIQSENVLNISQLRSVTTNGENGLLGLAFHPQFTSTKRIFVFYTHNIGGTRRARVSSFLVTEDDPIIADPDSEIIYFDQRDEASNHNGGDVHFGPDGYLYVSLGDEGGANDTYNNSQKVDKDFFAGIVRIDVDKLEGNVEPTNHDAVPRDNDGKAYYSVPFDNPLVAQWQQDGSNLESNLRTEFYAIGLRNPWRMAFDNPTGRLFVGDVGQGSREEVDIIVKGGNYGWSIREGFIAFNNGPGNLTPPPAFGDLLDPIHDYPRSDGQSITGGMVYRGTRLPELDGAYIFGDYGSGRIWALFEDGEGGYDRTQISSYGSHYEYGIDPSNGDVLISGGDGNIRRLVRGNGGEQPSFPATLSETGAFKSLESLETENGILAYEPNVSFWSDHAEKSRWVSVPDAQIAYSLNNNWGLPEGTIWIKHFELPLVRGNPGSAVRVETRFLVKTSQSVYGLSYRWNESGTEATLVDEVGVDINYDVEVDGQSVPQTWRIPSRQECLQCHTAAAGYALSFNARQLNRDQMIDGQQRNLLQYLSDIEIFDTPLDGIEAFPVYYPADDPEATRIARVRSYLAVNCVSCHQPGAVASTSWDARPFINLSETGLIDGFPLNNGGNADRRLVVPGDPELSVLLSRISASHGFARMPNIATNELDQTGISLISDWIGSISTGVINWQNQFFDNPESREADLSSDPDLDGRNNQFEFLTAMDPLDPNSFWQAQTEIVDGNLCIQIPVTQNRTYMIESSTNLETWSLWTVSGNPTQIGDELIASVKITGPYSEDSFYRIRISETN